MKQFNLNEYLANPSKKIITRDGRNVRIRCTNVKRKFYPVLALVDNGGYESSVLYTENGEYSFGEERSLDLFFVTEKHEGWVNLYKSINNVTYCGGVFETEEEARKEISANYRATIKIEWEE